MALDEGGSDELDMPDVVRAGRIARSQTSVVDKDGWIRCSHCDAKIRPHAKIAESGWMQYGWIGGELDGVTMSACPDCWPRVGRRGREE